jgi:C1A family cysteine protease
VTASEPLIIDYLDMYKAVVLAILVATVLTGTPNQFDWRNVGAITSPGTQGSCDSSVAFTVATMYATEYYRQTANLITRSAEFLLECSGSLSCNSGTSTYQNLQAVATYAINNGIALDSAFPYTANTTSTGTPTTSGICSSTTLKAPKSIKLNKKYKASTGTFKSWIAKNPVGAMIDAEAGFNALTSDAVYTCSNINPTDAQENQAVVAIGYTTNTDWIVQNSMGTSFGNLGVVTIKKGKDCGIRRRIFRYNYSLQTVVTILLVLVSLFAF